MRIIAGCWKGRKISFPDGEGLRPTGDRIRETLFNWLMPFMPGARCLDLFAGSGALGFEALSRGASHCVLIENNPEAFRHLQASSSALIASGAEIICADADRWLESASGKFDIVFLDPPFAAGGGIPMRVVETLQRCHLLSDNAWVYLEQPRGRAMLALPGLQLHREQQTGQIHVSLWRVVSTRDQQNAFDA